MKHDKINMSQEMRDALGAVKQGEEELRRRKTKILPSLSVLLKKSAATKFIDNLRSNLKLYDTCPAQNTQLDMEKKYNKMLIMTNQKESGNSPTHELPTPVEHRPEKLVVIGTRVMSKGKPHLYFWRDLNSYNNDPYTIALINSKNDIEKAARISVVKMFAYYDVDQKKAQGGIKKVEISGTTTFTSIEDISASNPKEWKWKTQRVPMVFVEVMPSLIKELTQRGGGRCNFFAAEQLKPNSKANSPMERKVERAFKKFVANKTSKRTK